MGRLDNIQKSIFEIRSLIQTNSEVRKMVYFDGADALSQQTPTITQVKDHFTVSAVFDITKPPFTKNTIVSISLSSGSAVEDLVSISGTVRINVLTKSSLWELENNKIRPLEISNVIIDLLDNKKISASHKLGFQDIDLAVIDEDVNGYTLTFYIEEGVGLDEQF